MTTEIRRRAWLITAAVTISAAAVIASVFVGRPVVATHDELEDLSFGLPIPWLHQDQGLYDPPFPSTRALGSVWEDPTFVAWWAFAADVAIVLAVAAGLWIVGHSVVDRRQPRANATHEAGL